MEINQKALFEKLLRTVGQLYQQSLHRDTLNLYWHLLKKYPWPAIQWAFKYHMQNPDTGCWMPKPADIIRYLEGDTTSKTLKAWSQVQSALRTVGSYGSIQFSDKRIHGVIQDMGGWTRLCQSSERDMGFIQREFEQRYKRYLVYSLENKQPLLASPLQGPLGDTHE